MCLPQIEAVEVAPQVSIGHNLQPNHGLYASTRTINHTHIYGSHSVEIPLRCQQVFPVMVPKDLLAAAFAVTETM